MPAAGDIAGGAGAYDETPIRLPPHAVMPQLRGGSLREPTLAGY
jgi:hypothetical protein